MAVRRTFCYRDRCSLFDGVMMRRLQIGDRETVYIDVGDGAPLVCIHGSFSDCRVWGPVVDLLSADRRIIAPSLRYFYPERWSGNSTDYTVERHVEDVGAFISALRLPPVDLLGHSRGGHIAFRVCQKYPGLVRRAILAEPGGSFEEVLQQPSMARSPLLDLTTRVSELVRSGEVDDGLCLFLNAIDGDGTWESLSDDLRQQMRDNASTLLAQPGEGRKPFTVADAESMIIPTLIVIGEDTPGFLPSVSRQLAIHLPHCNVVNIPDASHHMFRHAPALFSAAVSSFLDDGTK